MNVLKISTLNLSLGEIYMSKGAAYFVEHPSTIYDLRVPHLLCLEKEYDIVKTIQLTCIDYENFCFDLLADRQFLSDNAHLCSDFPLFRCLYVKANGHTDGILVIPDNQAYVKLAAYHG